MRHRSLGALIALTLLSCVDARSGAGAECARNSQCAAPLVCALESCRNECNSSRDCPIGAACIRSEDGFGVCQLEAEITCGSGDECTDPLVCQFDTCTNTCVRDAECSPGAECRDGACFDPSGPRCETDGECAPLACIDGRCLPSCRSDRDCRLGAACVEGACVVATPTDAGTDVAVDAPDVPDASGDTDRPSLCDPNTLDARAVAVGESFACALIENGTVWCWGSNVTGQLGNSTLALTSGGNASAVRVDDIEDAIAIAAGHSHACALLEDGSVMCWGDHTRGQCGVGAPTEVIRSPRPIAGGFVAAALGSQASCVLDGDIVSCFGSRSGGALADGSTAGVADTPVLATAVGPTRALAYTHSGGVSLLADGSIFSWGESDFATATPTYVSPTFVDATSVAMGVLHACLLRSDGQVYCAGDNGEGQLGDPSRGAGDPTFAVVPGLTGVMQIDATSSNTCALTTEGELYCWGGNFNGSLGFGDTLVRDEPTLVELPATVTAFSVGRVFSCAVAGGRVYCWGNGASGRLGVDPPPPNPYLPNSPVECLP